jgi:pimeloyl-ACP methyl ester carboxylesterase
MILMAEMCRAVRSQPRGWDPKARQNPAAQSHSTWVVLENASHLCHLEQPDAYRRVLRGFFSEVEAGGGRWG